VVIDSPAVSLRALFGSPDDLKFRSSMTLFAIAGPDGLCQAALDRWCPEGLDRTTVELLAKDREPR
jgi:uncharacterized protein (DUF1810 family)